MTVTQHTNYSGTIVSTNDDSQLNLIVTTIALCTNSTPSSQINMLTYKWHKWVIIQEIIPCLSISWHKNNRNTLC